MIRNIIERSFMVIDNVVIFKGATYSRIVMEYIAAIIEHIADNYNEVIVVWNSDLYITNAILEALERVNSSGIKVTIYYCESSSIVDIIKNKIEHYNIKFEELDDCDNIE